MSLLLKISLFEVLINFGKTHTALKRLISNFVTNFIFIFIFIEHLILTIRNEEKIFFQSQRSIIKMGVIIPNFCMCQYVTSI